MSERVDAIGRIKIGFFKVALEELLNSANFEIALPASKESVSFWLSFCKVGLKQLFQGLKKRLLSTDAAFNPMDVNFVVFKVNIV